MDSTKPIFISFLFAELSYLGPRIRAKGAGPRDYPDEVTGKKGYKTGDDKSISTGTWSVPVGKFKETEFYVKIEPN